MDKTDEQILQVLRQDSRAAFVDIAAKVGLSEAAVRRRVSNLVKEGTIKKFTIDVDEPQTATSAITYVSVSPSAPTADVSKKLKSVRGVETIYETTGGSFDAPPPPGQQTVAVGSGTMSFQSCSAATFNYNFTGGSSSGLSGTIPLSRVGPV